MTHTHTQNEFLNPFGTTKLLDHVDRLAEWRTTGDTRPVHVGLDITNACNHRCPNCNGADFSDTRSIPLPDLRRLITELSEIGVRGVSFGGGGDASCHPHVAETLEWTHRNGIDAGVFTNGYLMRDATKQGFVEHCKWVRISLDADGPEMYEQTHGMNGSAFQRVLQNSAALVQRRDQARSAVTIGVSYLIGEHTISGIRGAAEIAAGLGVDYIRLRPFFTYGGAKPFPRDDVPRVLEALALAKELETDSFKVLYPAERTAWSGARDDSIGYDRCHIHRFAAEIAADMKVYLCCHMKGLEKYEIGDLRRKTFLEIWNSERRRDVCANIDFKDCALPCKHAPHNELLHMIAAPVAHANFL